MLTGPVGRRNGSEAKGAYESKRGPTIIGEQSEARNLSLPVHPFGTFPFHSLAGAIFFTVYDSLFQ